MEDDFNIEDVIIAGDASQRSDTTPAPKPFSEMLFDADDTPLDRKLFLLRYVPALIGALLGLVFAFVALFGY